MGSLRSGPFGAGYEIPGQGLSRLTQHPALFPALLQPYHAPCPPIKGEGRSGGLRTGGLGKAFSAWLPCRLNGQVSPCSPRPSPDQKCTVARSAGETPGALVPSPMSLLVPEQCVLQSEGRGRRDVAGAEVGEAERKEAGSRGVSLECR